MKRLRESWDGQVAVTALTWADFTALGANTDDFTGISGQVKSLTEPKLSLIVAETAAGVLRGSLRINTGKSPKDINLSKLASLLGGGGHPRAAGFNLLGSLELPEGGQWKVNLKPGKIGG